jgi:hypothetical protein
VALVGTGRGTGRWYWSVLNVALVVALVVGSSIFTFHFHEDVQPVAVADVVGGDSSELMSELMSARTAGAERGSGQKMHCGRSCGPLGLTSA